MPYEEIYFSYNTYYKGRNGFATQTGMVVKKSVNNIMLYPLNTRGYSDACILSFPINEAENIANAIKEIAKENEMSKV